MSKVVLDIHGREIKEGDLLRIFHYKDRSTRRNVYLYKLVIQHFDDLVCVDACKWALNARLLSVHPKHSNLCPLSVLPRNSMEIIDGIDVMDKEGRMHCWYDRKKNAKPEDE